jgi:2-polyprenyl-6-methoxyphenol hydroxylase-like FAD-dependent oxidoreductase
MKAIISGAGIAGLSSALAVHRAGWEVTVLERAPGLRSGGYMLDFFGPGYEAAEALGVIDALKARGDDVEHVDFVNADGRLGSSMDYGRMRQAAGGKLFPILRGDIEKVLYEALPDSADLRFSTELATISETGRGVAAKLSDGQEIEADLLVGADGIHSLTRKLVFGPEQDFLRFLGFHTAAYFFESTEVSRALGGQFKMMAIPAGMAGFFDVGSGRIMAFFVMRAESEKRPADPRGKLREAFGDLGWVLPEALAKAPDSDIYYDIVAQVEMPAWHKGRVMLVGDAAYAVSLLAGQGASLAIAGGRALGQVLEGTSDIEAALARMDRQLRPLVAEKQRAGRRMANWFVPKSHLHEVVRDLAVNAMNWPPLAGLLGQFFSFSSKGFSLRQAE